MKTFKLHLIRHGITAGNLQGLYCHVHNLLCVHVCVIYT